MKITAARVIVCCPGRNFVTLKLETDAGLTGVGDATLNGRELAVRAYLEEHIVPALMGRDPMRGEASHDVLPNAERRPAQVVRSDGRSAR